MGSSIRAHGQLAAILALGAAVRGWLLARPIAALDGRVESQGPAGIRPRRDDERWFQLVAHLDGRADLRDVLFRGYHALAAHVAATLRPGLVFQDHAGRAHLDQRLNHVNHVERAAEAGVAIDDHANRTRPADAPRHIEALALREESEVGLT